MPCVWIEAAQGWDSQIPRWYETFDKVAAVFAGLTNSESEALIRETRRGERLKKMPFLPIILLAWALPAHAQDAMKEDIAVKPTNSEMKVVLDS